MKGEFQAFLQHFGQELRHGYRQSHGREDVLQHVHKDHVAFEHQLPQVRDVLDGQDAFDAQQAVKGHRSQDDGRAEVRSPYLEPFFEKDRLVHLFSVCVFRVNTCRSDR